MKQCNTCGMTYPLADYQVDKRRPGTRGAKCRHCRNAEKRARPAEERRRYQLKFHYGITPEEYAQMEAAQGGACAICGEVKPLVVDHHHKSRRVRKLLCHNCNLAIGHLQDDPYIAAKAAEYLKEN